MKTGLVEERWPQSKTPGQALACLNGDGKTLHLTAQSQQGLRGARTLVEYGKEQPSLEIQIIS